MPRSPFGTCGELVGERAPVVGKECSLGGERTGNGGRGGREGHLHCLADGLEMEAPCA